MPLDLEFHIMIGNIDVTRDVIRWGLTDTESGKSSIEVGIASPEDRYVDAFDPEDEISLTWGDGSDSLGPVQFKLNRIRPDWGLGGTLVNLNALDWTERMDNQSSRGTHPADMGTDEIIEETIKRSGLEPRVDVISPKVPKDHQFLTPQMTQRDVVQRYSEMSSSNKSWDEGAYIDLRSDTKKPKDKPYISGAVGPILPKSTFKGAEEDDGDDSEGGSKKPIEKNRVGNQAKEAASYSIRGSLRVVDYPFMRAKECVTVLGAGHGGSGDWYVQTVSHQWDVMSGYSATCTLLKPETAAKEGNKKKGGAPNVMYAEIFEKNVVYVGPRKLDAPSQKTFEVGDGKHVTSFSWTLDVQTPKDAGEQIVAEDRPVNRPEKTETNAAWTPPSGPSSGGGKPPSDGGGTGSPGGGQSPPWP